MGEGCLRSQSAWIDSGKMIIFTRAGDREEQVWGAVINLVLDTPHWIHF